MAKGYSTDLRARAVALVEAGEPPAFHDEHAVASCPAARSNSLAKYAQTGVSAVAWSNSG
jgi:hypothetical protein